MGNIDWTLAGAVMLSGLVIVFIGLIILILAVWIMGRLIGTAKPKPKEAAPPSSAAAPAAPVSVEAPIAASPSGDEGEVVAAISAAIACVMDETAPGTPYSVTSIRRTAAGRPVWGFAGMQQNTRPF